MPQRIIVSVTNDLVTDQRVKKTCAFLHRNGFKVILVGRKLEGSLPISRPYRTHRMRLAFTKGPLFYFEYNLRLFFFLLKNRADILLANDLDTLLANYLAFRFRRGKRLVYDSHEYFTEVPELEGRWARKVWLTIESWIFPQLEEVYTVNRSIADIYQKKYRVDVKVVHNYPDIEGLEHIRSRKELGLPEDKRILIMQGAGLNLDRGGEEAVQAMALLPEEYQLLIVGSGDRLAQMMSEVARLGLEGRVQFRPKMPYQEMMQFTFNADLGLSLDKGTNANYRYALPNKVVDYMAAGIPVLSSNMVETERFILEHSIGWIIDEVTPERIAQGVEEAFSARERFQGWKESARRTRESINWKNEEQVLEEIFSPGSV
ncbi:MAG: glycosyltransferase [Flavobacteriales bacterium]|nr:glycosyltransferase [Flavobacteriales bacterium]